LGDDINSIIAETHRRFGEGMKVAVKITLIATSTGLINTGKKQFL
jgi:hypothetical protein